MADPGLESIRRLHRGAPEIEGEDDDDYEDEGSIAPSSEELEERRSRRRSRPKQ